MSSRLDWSALVRLQAEGQPFTLVTVAAVKGSSPRESGTKMAVFADRVLGTIGGGNLEFFAIEHARERLETAEPNRLHQHRTSLIPRFDQCCGGVVQLVFEKVVPGQTPWLVALAAFLGNESRASAWLVSDLVTLTRALRFEPVEGETDQPAADGEWLLEPVGPSRPEIIVFGAGHVGRALAAALAPLGLDVTLWDTRPDQLAQANEMAVRQDSDDWQALVDAASDDACFVIMTHSHQLDFAIVESVLAKDRFRYCGLIGSATKRRRFGRLLEANGMAPDRFGRVTCPIGLPEIQGKSPEIIAASVCAQILMVQSATAEQRPNQTLSSRSLGRVNHV